MKVMRGALASIALAVAIGVAPNRVAAEEAEASCNEQYLLCINAASQKEGFLDRTWAEQRCNAAWYACVRRAVTGA